MAEIEAMDRAALITAWSDVFGSSVPKSLSQPFLRRFLAFEIQARRSGGLPKGFVAMLERQAAGAKAFGSTSAPKPGGRYLREWNGATHVVEVTGDGYTWKGQRHRSLSAVARAITGARWSGPRFFGLKEGVDR